MFPSQVIWQPKGGFPKSELALEIGFGRVACFLGPELECSSMVRSCSFFWSRWFLWFRTSPFRNVDLLGLGKNVRSLTINLTENIVPDYMSTVPPQGQFQLSLLEAFRHHNPPPALGAGAVGTMNARLSGRACQGRGEEHHRLTHLTGSVMNF